MTNIQKYDAIIKLQGMKSEILLKSKITDKDFTQEIEVIDEIEKVIEKLRALTE